VKLARVALPGPYLIAYMIVHGLVIKYAVGTRKKGGQVTHLGENESLTNDF